MYSPYLSAQDYLYQVQELLGCADFISLNLGAEETHYSPDFVSRLVQESQQARLLELGHSAIHQQEDKDFTHNSEY